MKELLEKIEIINYKYEKLNSKNQFNIISLLNKINDEVNLHSKLIATLLNPSENHNLGNKPLKCFLSQIGIKNFNLEDCFVEREYENIDIFIANNNQAIIIENKIWAEDQERQLQRYYDIIVSRGYKDIWIYYLTLDGREPSESSIGNLDEKIDLISYSFHIKEWIESCIEFAAKHPALRESLAQYQDIIKELIGNTMEEEQKNEIIELLSKNDNVLKAQAIAENWKHVKWHTEWCFWQDLEKELSKSHEIMDVQKYSAEFLNTVYHKSRNRNPWYGLMYEFARIEDLQICLFIERGWNDLYYGLTILSDGKKRDICQEVYDDLAHDICGWGQENLWVGGNFFKPNIDFESFSEKETLILLNDDKRSKRILAALKEIKDFELNCKEKIGVPNIVYN